MYNLVALDLFAFIISVSLLLWFMFSPWQRLCEDLARQRISKMKDDLFLYAADGNIAFDNPDYTNTKVKLASLIKEVHTFTWHQILFRVIFLKKDQVIVAGQEFFRIVTPLKLEVKTHIELVLKEAMNCLVMLMWVRSPFLLAITLLMGVIVLCIGPLIIILRLIDVKLYPFVERAKLYLEKIIHSDLVRQD